MQDNLESYACGSAVGADFCFTEVLKVWDFEAKEMVYSCVDLAFNTEDLEEGGRSRPGDLLWKNTISAVVLRAADDPEPPEPPLPPQSDSC